MKTKEQISHFIKENYTADDQIEWEKLSLYLPHGELWTLAGFMSKHYNKVLKDITYENIVKDLKEDVERGLKAGQKRSSITSTVIYKSVQIWLWVLEDDLYDFNKYSPFGLPLYEAVALKYRFEY